jgi:catechol 2,3-dioxygenase-like lactoylglutathione lyase family enzyme
VLDSLDHIVIAVDDLAAAERLAITLLGRSPSWTGHHPAFGTRNTIFKLSNTYLELLAPDGEGAVADGLRARLRDAGPGLHALALGTPDAEAAAAELRAAGLSPTDPIAGLAQDEPSGAWRRFRNVMLPPDDTHGVGLFVIEQLSEPELLPPALPIGDEAATVTGVDHVVVMTGDPERAIDLYAKRLGIRLALDRTFEKRGVRLIFFRIGGVTIEIAASLRAGAELGRADGARDRLWGLALQVDDVDRARARLVEAGLDVTPIRDGNKPGTRVCTVKGEPLGVATLVIEPVKH